MRRRLQRFLPIVLIALAVQVLAPIAACWAAAAISSDPLGSAEICHGNLGSPQGQADEGGAGRSHNGACSICCVAQASASFDTPQPVELKTPHLQAAIVVWHQDAPQFSASRPGSNAQARAPPSLS